MATAQDQGVVVVGARVRPLRDAYHFLLRMPWWGILVTIAGGYLVINAFFAVVYMGIGGIAGAHERSFRDAFFFSVQTMGTIGYGAMYPQSNAANVVVVAESVVGLVITALATGIVFARFSITTGRLAFTSKACISPIDGVPTLSFRVGNERGNAVLEAQIRVSMVRTERTREGNVFYRLHDLALARDRSPALARSWTVMHPITASSPLHGASPETFVTDEIELLASVIGTDDLSLQPVHARHRYLAEDVLWGARHVDILSELPDGRLQLDVRKFDDVEPTAASEGFPYSTKR